MACAVHDQKVTSGVLRGQSACFEGRFRQKDSETEIWESNFFGSSACQRFCHFRFSFIFLSKGIVLDRGGDGIVWTQWENPICEGIQSDSGIKLSKFMNALNSWGSASSPTSTPFRRGE